MKISIAMATYNGASHLQQQLDSFVAQSRLPDELVVSDDRSSDSTITIVEEFASRAPFKVLYKVNDHNLGYSGNFNEALQMASGDLVLLSDQDDVWHINKIARLLEIAGTQSDQLLLINDAMLADGELNELGFTKLEQIRSAGMPDSEFVMGCCCAVRRELLELCLPIPTEFTSHDGWLVGFAEGMNSKFIVEDVLQLYRRHGNNVSEFLVNSTQRVTRLDVVKEQLAKLTRQPKQRSNAEKIQQEKMFCFGIERAIGRANEQQIGRLRRLLEYKQQYIAHLEARAKIRSKKLPMRALAALGLWGTGGYRYTSGLKSAIRDVIGH